MNITNALNPSEEQAAGFLEDPDAGPIYMVNLLKFRDQAQYKNADDNHVSGETAYGRYVAAVSEVIQQFGGKIIFSGQVSRLTIGAADELWDSVAIAQYPSRRAMLEMISSDPYRAIAHHRKAGLAGQLNIETRTL